VGTYDGFMAFEMWRRGARKVVAVDVPNHEDWDWPPDIRAEGGERLAQLAGPEKGKGFRIAREALGAEVEKLALSAYDLEPDQVGRFDVVVCGSLLLHLRDPLRALEAIRSVCDGVFMSSEEIDLPLSVKHPRRALARLNGSGPQCQWWVPNVAGHRRMVFAAGFEILRSTRPFSEPYGHAHPASSGSANGFRERIAQNVLTGNVGVPHAAVLARPRV
jgi:tRNA (mo5U34)-methyltransferase